MAGARPVKGIGPCRRDRLDAHGCADGLRALPHPEPCPGHKLGCGPAAAGIHRNSPSSCMPSTAGLPGQTGTRKWKPWLQFIVVCAPGPTCNVLRSAIVCVASSLGAGSSHSQLLQALVRRVGLQGCSRSTALGATMGNDVSAARNRIETAPYSYRLVTNHLLSHKRKWAVRSSRGELNHDDSSRNARFRTVRASSWHCPSIEYSVKLRKHPNSIHTVRCAALCHMQAGNCARLSLADSEEYQ